jgi:type VI secretion system secreted protein Hcp
MAADFSVKHGTQGESQEGESRAAAAVDYFLKIEGVAGESLDHKHKGEIDVLSWSWGASQSGSAAHGSEGGKLSVMDFHFVKLIDKATPKILIGLLTAKQFLKATFTGRKRGQTEEFLKYEFNDLLISSHTGGGTGTHVLPTEEISFSFVKLQFQVGSEKGSFDLKFLK